MKLKRLLKEIPLELYSGGKEIEFSGITSNSKRVVPGNLFIAKKGARDDGNKYVDEAIASGAVAILSDMGNPFLKEIVQLIHPDIHKIEGKLAATFYGNPSLELFTVGITGTNGKTTTSYIIKYLLDSLGKSCGLLGTIEYIRGQKRSPAALTTADVLTNHKLLKEMLSEGCQAAVLEVTSHALSQNRVDEIDFDVALFTNLTQDHLDYHQTMESYAAAKAKLFERLKPSAVALINSEDSASERMVKECRATVVRYGFGHGDFNIHDVDLQVDRSRFSLTYKGQTVRFETSLIGRHNVLNVTAAVATIVCGAVDSGYNSLSQLAALMKKFEGVRGRLERVGNYPVFVDYAHTPDALEKVMVALNELKKGRLLVVFGCGGDRDRLKRPLMGAVVERLADVAIITSDNPRSEDPMAIISQIIEGFKNKNYIIEVDRARAIKSVIELAQPNDVILIAGKGHETTQTFAHQTIAFDDREIARTLLAQESHCL